MSGDSYKYWAFISYSHRDRAWGDWLHKTLETYRVPSRLAGRESRDGKIPRRLFPIFRDRDELPSSANLGDALKESLKASRYQIVICSPRAAASRWVDEEVSYFKSLGRADRVLCLIVEGEPNVFHLPGRDIEECFCQALRHPAEPIAADAREHADGKVGAKLKLVAGLIGVGLDELIQRERQRQLWKNVQIAAAAVAFAGLCVGAWQWYLGKTAAREREIAIERIVESGRVELLEGRQARAAVLLNQAYKMGYDTVPLRFMLAQAMKPVEALTNVRVKHDGYGVYRSAAFSPDGKWFVLGGRDKENEQKAVARVYDAGTGRLSQELDDAPTLVVITKFFDGGKRFLSTGFTNEMRSGATVTRIWSLDSPDKPVRLEGFSGLVGEPLSADGQRVLIARGTGLDLYDVTDGRLVRTLGRGRKIAAATYSPDGNFIAFADGSGVVEVVSAQDGKRIKIFDAPAEGIVGLLYSADGSRLLGLSPAGDIRIWDLATGLLRIAFAADPNEVTALQLDGSGNRLLTVGMEGLKVWSSARGSLLFSIPTFLNLSHLATAVLSPDGNTLMVADNRSTVATAWDVRSRRQLYSLDLHAAGLTGAAFDRDGKRLLIAGRDGQAEIWAMPVTPQWKYESFTTLPFVARFSKLDTRCLLVAGGGFTDGSAMLFDLYATESPKRFLGHKLLIYDAAFSPSEKELITASADGTAAVWNVNLGARIGTLDHDSQEVASARFSADGLRILTSTSPETPSRKDAARLWDARSHSLVASLGHDDLIRAAQFSPDSRLVATGGKDKLIKLWDALDGHLLRTLAGHGAWVSSVEFNADSTELLSSAEDNSVRIWNVASGAVVHSVDDPSLGVPTQATFAPDGKSVAISSESGTVWLWTPRDKGLRALKGHEQQVGGVRFSASGELLFSYGYDGTARTWDTRSGEALGVVTTHDRLINYLELAADGSRLVTTSWGQVQVADVRPEARSPQKIAELLKCQAPWVFDLASGKLIPASIAAACAKEAGGASAAGL